MGVWKDIYLLLGDTQTFKKIQYTTALNSVGYGEVFGLGESISRKEVVVQFLMALIKKLQAF